MILEPNIAVILKCKCIFKTNLQQSDSKKVKNKIMIKDILGISSEKKSGALILKCEFKENIESTNDINC